MTPLIKSAEDVDRLRRIAEQWVGTPWTADGAIRGTGASCSMLPYAILSDYGMAIPYPPSRSGILKNQIIAAMEAYMAQQAQFFEEVPLTDITPGCVLMIDAGIGHMALVTGPGEIIHSWQTIGAHFAQYTEKRLHQRLKRAWRPII